MNELVIQEVVKNSNKGNGEFNDEAIEYLVDKINAILDIPLINEELERIIIQAIIKIITNLLFTQRVMKIS